MARYEAINTIMNNVAVESGLLPELDPWTSENPQFIQLRYLADSAGQELMELYEWPILRATHTIVVDNTTYPDGKYPLPDDFGYMIDQTQWNRDTFLPLQGPLTPQQWTYLEGRGLSTGTIYASFRTTDGEIWLYPPEALTDGQTITMEYIRRSWVITGGIGSESFIQNLSSGQDRPVYEPILFKRFLKLKFLSAKGFNTDMAAQEFLRAMDACPERY